jgi:hypothetical protein
MVGHFADLPTLGAECFLVSNNSRRSRRASRSGSTGRSPPSGVRARGRRVGARRRFRSAGSRSAVARPGDRTAQLPTQHWRLGRATASQRLAGRVRARSPAHSRCDTASCRSDGLSTSSHDHAARASAPPRKPKPSTERRRRSRAPTPRRADRDEFTRQRSIPPETTTSRRWRRTQSRGMERSRTLSRAHHLPVRSRAATWSAPSATR